MANEIEQRAITLPIASEGEKRKSTTDVTLAFKRILVVTSPQGTGGKRNKHKYATKTLQRYCKNLIYARVKG